MASIKSISDIITSQRTGLTKTQDAMVKAAPEEQQKFLTAQFMLENESQATSQITNMLKKMHEMAEGILRNLA